MSEIKNIVQSIITNQSVRLTRKGFGLPAVPVHNAGLLQPVIWVSAASEMLVAPLTFTTTDPEYKMVSAIFSNAISVEKVALVRRNTPVLFKSTISIDLAAENQVYSFTLGGQDFSFKADAVDTIITIAAGLLAAPNTPAALTDLTFVDNSDGTITVTNATAHAYPSFKSTTSAAYLSWLDESAEDIVAGTSAGLTADLILAADYDASWYALLLPSNSEVEFETASAWIEDTSNGERILIASTNNTVIHNALYSATSPTSGDYASEGKNATLNRSGLFHGQDDSQDAHARFAGRFLPTLPGSHAWQYKALIGATPSDLTNSEKDKLNSKNVNFYSAFASNNFCQGAKMLGGEWIDVVRGIDFTNARICENEFARQLATPKTPYTNSGVAAVVATLEATLLASAAQGILDADSIVITAPRVEDVSPVDRANRCLPDIVWTAKLTGAISKVIITGTVSP